LVALTAVAPLLAPASAEDDPEAGRPTAFVASAEAWGTQAYLNTVPPQVISDVVNARSPWVNTEFKTGGTSNATASLFDPGAAVTGGASLLCQAGLPCSDIPNFPPVYPLTAKASNPLAIDATAAINGDRISVGPIGTTAGDARAHAGRDNVTAAATVYGNSLGSAGLSLLSVGASTTTNDLSFAEDGSLIATSFSAVNDVDVLGTLHFDSIAAKSTSIARTDGTTENDVQLDIQGASLAGTPITIGDQGLSIGGNAQGGGVLAGLGQVLTPLLQAFRGSVRTLGTTDIKDSAGASGSSTGVLIELFPNVDALVGLSPRINVLLAFAGSHAYTFDSPGGLFSGGFGGSGGTSGTSGTAGSFVPGRPATPGSVIPGTTAALPDSGQGVVEEVVVGLLSGVAADRLKFFYLAWTLSMLGCALGSRLKPARLDALRTPGGPDARLK
jgi:hypothetical protein